MYYLLFLYIAGLVTLFENGHSMRMLKAIPGVPTVRYVDNDYVRDVVLTTRRYSRKGDYLVNLEFTTLYTFGYNLSLSGIFYEYLHNEYRRSFVELHGSLCYLILKEPLVGAVVRKVGITKCPLPAGSYKMHNMSFDQEFPNIFPFEKGKGELVAKLASTGKLIAKGDLVLTFKQREVTSDNKKGR